jgi:N-acetyl-anhydromuramyl-L-alanine amidase AmpD
VTPLARPCSREFYKAVHSSGTRRLREIIWVVLHDEEAVTARSAAASFQNPKSAGSAHLCVDDNECYRCLANEDIPWAARGANEKGQCSKAFGGHHTDPGPFYPRSMFMWFCRRYRRELG